MENEKGPVEWLQDVIRINTVEGNESEMAAYIGQLLDDAGIEYELVEYAPGRNNLIATLKKGNGKKVLGISGHMDVVPIGATPWKYDPFGGELVTGGVLGIANRIYGRGASDMKSGLMTMVAAMINVKENDVDFNGTIKLIATVAEETGLKGSEFLVEQGLLNDLTAVAISEPTVNIPFAYYKGVFRIRLTTTGKKADSANPENGINAAEHLRYYLNRYQKEIAPLVPEFTDEQLGGATISLNVVGGGDDISQVPDTCKAEIEVRTIPELHYRKEWFLGLFEQLRDSVAQEVENFKMEIECFVDNAPVNTPRDHPFLKLAAKAANVIVSPVGLPGCTDGSSFIRISDELPIAIMGCGEGAHYTDEFVLVSTYKRGITIYEKLIKSYLTDEEDEE